ncbi:MAG: hypothetical protein GY716_03120 [bacterium]|nr:hypothetical protein [bacterium]
MTDQQNPDRPVRIFGCNRTTDGLLSASIRLRTIDDLNSVSKNFVRVHGPKAASGDSAVLDGPMAINKRSILFVQELNPPTSKPKANFGNFDISPVQFQVGDYTVQGFVHVPPGGSPMKRLDQDHTFLAVTTALVSGPDGEFTAPFLALNKRHIATAQVATVAQPVG